MSSGGPQEEGEDGANGSDLGLSSMRCLWRARNIPVLFFNYFRNQREDDLQEGEGESWKYHTWTRQV